MKEIISFPFFSANNPDKNVTFYEACEAGNVETVKSLLQSRDREWQDDPESQSYSIDVNYVCESSRYTSRYTPLYIACINWRFDVIKILLQHPHVNPNLKSAHEITAFQYACNQGPSKAWYEVIEAFLKRPDLKVNELLPYGRTEISVLTLACLTAHDTGLTAHDKFNEIVKLLLSSGRLSNENKLQAFKWMERRDNPNILSILLQDPYLEQHHKQKKCSKMSQQSSWQAESVSNKRVMDHSMS